MGYGDNLMASGMARGARRRGVRIAFGDRRNIIWDKHSEEIFLGNPNVARPGDEGSADLEWLGYYKGSRLYNRHDHERRRWVWNYDFRPEPGEMFFDAREIAAGKRYGAGFVLIEWHVEAWKHSSVNKDWGLARYQAVADGLGGAGYTVAQFQHHADLPQLQRVRSLRSRSFRDALSIMENAAAYIGPEGGLHHGAAAVGTPAVVLFGGFIPPLVTGYPDHVNLTGGAEACGSLTPCHHCRTALDAISPEEVIDALKTRLAA